MYIKPIAKFSGASPNFVVVVVVVVNFSIY